MDGVTERRIRELERTVSQLSAHVSSIRSRPADVSTPPIVRMARTYNNGSYPGSGNTFPFTFVDITYTESAGTQTPTVTERNASNVGICHNLSNSYIAVNSLVPVIAVGDRYFTWSGSSTGNDSQSFVRIKAHSGSPSACDNTSRNSSYCYYNGAVVGLAGSPDFCTDPWTESTAIWIADVDRCDAATQLKYNDVYLGRKMSDSFSPGGGAASRPLYLIRHTPDSSGSDVKVVKVTSTSGSDCDDATEVSLSECVWSGKLQSVSTGGANMCSPYSDGADIFVIKTSDCCDMVLKKNERYLALKVGSYTSAAVGATRDCYAVFGSFCNDIQRPRIAFANGRISWDASGSVYLAEEDPTNSPLKGVLDPRESATTLTVKNPLNGDIMDGTKLLVMQAEVRDTGASTVIEDWIIAPMTLVYRGQASGTINAGSSGTVTVYNSAGSTTGETVTAHHKWMTGGAAIASAAEVIIQWFPFEERWNIIGAACP